MLGAEGLARLKEACDDQVSTPFYEANFEANPESLTDDVLAAARRSGFTRVSLGAQSFDDRELRALGRIHDARRARERVAAARASGLDRFKRVRAGSARSTWPSASAWTM